MFPRNLALAPAGVAGARVVPSQDIGPSVTRAVRVDGGGRPE